MSILSKIFEVRGIKDITDLDKEEQETYGNYEKILSKEELTIKDIEHFLESQIGVIEAKWSDYNNKCKEDLIPYHTIYRTLLNLIKSPQVEREQLEVYLKQLHNL